jgi:sporulation protein YlmC with PRC-barrel domain
MRDPKKWGIANQGGKTWNPHLRSTHKVSGYHIQATNGEIGHIEDFIIDDDRWTIRYFIIDTKNWLQGSGKKVLISPQWIKNIDWRDSKMFVDLSCEDIKQAPEYTESSLLTRDCESKFWGHYSRQGYWDDELIPMKGSS